jgi:hypothetical protein
MAQAGFTPIQLYYSTTTTNVPTSGNLADGELAINVTDGKLFYKDNGGVVQTIATKNAVTNVASISFGSTGLTPSTATTGAVTVAGTLAATSGGTGQSSYAVGDLVYASTTTALSKLADVATGNALISGGVGVAPAYGKIGLTTHVSDTLPVANGGTGAASLTLNNVLLGNGASALQTVAPGSSGNVLTSNGTTWQSSPSSVSGSSLSQQDTSVTITDSLTSFTASVAPSTAFNVEGTISGSTLTVTTIQGTGAIVVGAVVTGIGVIAGSTISAFGTGTGGTGTYTLSTAGGNSISQSYTITYSTMTVTAVASGTIAVGNKLSNKLASTGANLAIPVDTFITALGTGSGGNGTYILNKSFTLSSSTIYGSGTITSTVDNAAMAVMDGSGMSVRSVPQLSDYQGAITSGRMIGAYSSRAAGGSGPYYYGDINSNGEITSADALAVNRIITGDAITSQCTAAFASAYGSNGRSVGVGFAPLTPPEILDITVDLNRASTEVNSVIFGFMDVGFAPRIAISRFSGSFGSLPDAMCLKARFVKNTGGFALSTPRTITSATYQQAIDDAYLIFNTSATCTLTLLPATDVVVTGTINNGSNTAAGTTLTVTDVSYGTLYVGQKIYAPEFGSSREITITAFGTGTGGLGTYTVDTSLWVSCTRIVAPAAIGGNILRLKTTAAFAVNSASSNVVPLTGGAAGTAILAATAGKWCELVYDGTNWVIMAAN